MWQRLKNTGWFFAFLVMGLLVSADFDEKLEPRPEKMGERLEELSHKIQPYVTLFEVLTEHPEEFWEMVSVFDTLKNHYADAVEDRKLIAGAISGMVNHLEPHSYYFDREQYQDWQQFHGDTPSSSLGVGIHLVGVQDGGLKIGEVVDNSPAHRAGLRYSDIITHVNGQSVRWQRFNSVLQQIHKELPTGLQLTIRRKKVKNAFTVSLKGELITWPLVRIQWLKSHLVWVYISEFSPTMVKELIPKINQLFQKDIKPQGLVLDLRENPGGLVSSALTLASAFLPRNTVVMSLEGRTPYYNKTLKTSYQKNFPSALQDIPMVVLVNGGSASASELIAGALQDHHRATIVGTRTFGKGIMQTSYGLRGFGAGFQFTTAHYYLPSGRSIQAEGIQPDVWIDDNPDTIPYAALRKSESDYPHYLVNHQNRKNKNFAEEEALKLMRQKAYEEALTLWEEEKQKPLSQRKLLRLFYPPVGSDDDLQDVQLKQATDWLKNNIK